MDGHGGHNVATKAAEVLHDHILEHSRGRSTPELGEAIRRAYSTTDEACCCDSPHEYVGAVCCSAILTADQRLCIGANPTGEDEYIVSPVGHHAALGANRSCYATAV